MAITPINHYSLENHPTIYDEESLTVLELVARLAGKLNQVISQCNTNKEKVDEIIRFIETDYKIYVTQETYRMINEMLENGSFSEMVNHSRISVRTFGAVGDGVTDDTDAMSAWFEFIDTNGFTGYIPRGVWLTSQSFISKSGKYFEVIGESKADSVIKMTDPNSSCFAVYDSKAGFTIRNLTVDMNQTANSTHGIALYGKDVSNVVWEDIIVKNIGYGGILVYPEDPLVTCDNIFVSRVEMYGFGGTNVDGVRPTGFLFSGVKNCHVTNCHAENIRYYAFEFKNFSSGCFMTDCMAVGCYQGFYLGGDAKLPTGRSHYTEFCNFSNCVAYDCDNPFYFGMCANVSANNCQAYNPGTPTVKSIGFNLRNAKNCSVTGTFWYRYTGIDIRNSENIYVNAGIFRYEDASKAQPLTTFVEPLVNVAVCINATNDTVMREKAAVSGVTLNYANKKLISMQDPRDITLLGTNEIDHVTANHVIEAPTLVNAYNSQDKETPYVQDIYGSRTKARIEVHYKYGENKVQFRFYDGSGNLAGIHEIKPGT